MHDRLLCTVQHVTIVPSVHLNHEFGPITYHGISLLYSCVFVVNNKLSLGVGRMHSITALESARIGSSIYIW